MIEPTRDRVQAYEKALGCSVSPDDPGWCYEHSHSRPVPGALGCPVAVAAARVEAERVAEVRP